MSILSDKNLAAFDFDGVLADTEPLHHRAKEIMAGRIGVKKQPDYEAFVGLPNKDFWLKVLTDNALSGLPVEELEKRQYEIILKIAEDEKLKPTAGVEDLLDFLAGRGLSLAVCSSSVRFYLDKMMIILGLVGRFDFLVGGDEVPRKKPEPDVYLRALALTGLTADQSFAVEDSNAGTAAAVSAGYLTIGYLNPGSGAQDLSQAGRRVTTLAEIKDFF